MTLGKRIKIARERLNKGQEEVGRKFGISKQAVSQWERDETTPEFDKIPELRKLLRVPYSWLLAGSGPPPALDDIETALDDLTSEQRAAVAGLIQSFQRQSGLVA